MAISVAAVALGWSAGVARGDGDPASDVLVTQPLFLPQDAGVSAARQAQLGSLLNAAARDGYQLRVAIIASRTDLGSVTELWRQPQTYARFLAEEVSLIYHGALLVVMPDGYGVYRPNRQEPGPAALAGALAPGSGLAVATLGAIQRLARAAGHPLEVSNTTEPSGSGSSDMASWLVFALGCVLIVLAWSASLRAMPPRVLRQQVKPD